MSDILTILMVIVLVIALGVPGYVAWRRGHPNRQAITILGVAGLAFGGIPWLIALVWALVGPDGSGRGRRHDRVVRYPADDDPIERMKARQET